MRRWLVRGIIAVPVSLLFLFSPHEPYGNNKIYLATHNYAFSFFGWEARNFPQKWLALVRKPFSQSLAPQEQDALVNRYFTLGNEANKVAGQIREIAAKSSSSQGKGELEHRLEALRAERESLRTRVEEILEDRLTQLLTSQKLGMPTPFGPLLFPPVDLVMERLPKILVVSPRDRIELTDSVFIRSEMAVEEMERLEKAVESQNLSALVDNIGGVSSYPATVPDNANLRFIISTISHEWLHHYFFFQPLGMRYWRSYDMAIINETAADIAGEELADLILEKYGAAWGEEGAGQRPSRRNAAPADSPFRRDMRRVRLKVDELLREGKIGEAEQFMEDARIYLGQKGYYIRKLNQAYFAFYGSYATGAASSSPIGGELQRLRERSTSVGQFVKRVSAVTSHQQLKELIKG